MKIAIVGAGVSGVCCSLLLAALSHDVELFERHVQISTLGAGVVLFPKAVGILDQLGVLSEIEPLASKHLGIHRLSPSGRLLQETDLRGGKESLHSSIAILRRDLMKILGDQLQTTSCHFSRKMNTTDIAELQNYYDLILGCDGRMNSVCRRSIFPDIAPIYHGFVNVIGISHIKTMGKRLIRDYWQPNQRFGVVPVTEQTVYWAAAWVVSRPDRQSFTIQDLTMRFRDWPIQELLSHVEAHSLQTIFVHDIDPLPKWNQGKLLLLGDSAHAPLPTSGQGASQAIEDAWCLCQLLKESQSLDWIFHEFFSLRSQHTTRVQLLGRRLAQDLFPHAEDNDQIHSDSI